MDTRDIVLLRPIVAKSSAVSPASPLEEEVLALFSEFRGPLLRYLGSLNLQVQDGEEVVQEVFLALFLHIQHGKPRTNLRAWIFTVGHHLGLKLRMRNDRLWRLQTHDDSGVQPHDPSPGPGEHVESEERRRALMAIVRVLPETDRCCLFLRAEGLRYREIAKVLGISLGAVSLSLSRSLARLSNVDKRQ